MPQITVNVQAIRRGDTVELDVRDEAGRYIQRTVKTQEVNTPLKLMTWAVSQEFEQDDPVTEINATITATIHQEQDPEGNPFWVVDSVDEVVPT